METLRGISLLPAVLVLLLGAWSTLPMLRSEWALTVTVALVSIAAVLSLMEILRVRLARRHQGGVSRQ